MLERVWSRGNSLTLLVGMQTGEQCGSFLKKLQIELPNDPAIPLPGRHTEESTTERDTCTRVHCSAVYNSQDMEATYVSTATCPLADECIKEVIVHIHNGTLLSYKKEYNESVVMRWMNLKPFIQSEVKKRNTNTVY